MDGTDVMQSGKDEKKYQIYQGRMGLSSLIYPLVIITMPIRLCLLITGNHTRFINHSCAPNSQFRKFTWLGHEHIIVVSRGVEAGEEITVDYSNEYWEGLDKVCLCGEACCRYLKRTTQ